MNDENTSPGNPPAFCEDPTCDCAQEAPLGTYKKSPLTIEPVLSEQVEALQARVVAIESDLSKMAGEFQKIASAFTFHRDIITSLATEAGFALQVKDVGNGQIRFRWEPVGKIVVPPPGSFKPGN